MTYQIKNYFSHALWLLPFSAGLPLVCTCIPLIIGPVDRPKPLIEQILREQVDLDVVVHFTFTQNRGVTLALRLYDVFCVLCKRELVDKWDHVGNNPVLLGDLNGILFLLVNGKLSNLLHLPQVAPQKDRLGVGCHLVLEILFIFGFTVEVVQLLIEVVERALLPVCNLHHRLKVLLRVHATTWPDDELHLLSVCVPSFAL